VLIQSAALLNTVAAFAVQGSGKHQAAFEGVSPFINPAIWLTGQSSRLPNFSGLIPKQAPLRA
jgi:hypothetical protein